MVEVAKSNRKTKMTVASLWVKTERPVPYHLTLSSTVMIMMAITKSVMKFKNHAVQCSQLASPMIFIDSCIKESGANMNN